MTREEVFSKIKDIIVEHFDVDDEQVTENTRIKEDLQADSIAIMEFVLELEDAFNEEVSDDDAEKIETVGGAVDYIMAHQ
ncbi:acyl carrier protein [Vagococcus penaei]|uniref:Acyl carrier protein n=1 Tax=Vagococcus penaei TaxID=633807 RepID=A0A1Q2D6X5_9ENTE|nr:acyl carrier protein [Vagococcus penaei]AQP54070.1 acyl carrier protein [Vagococcus penaei]RSU01697.1 acyl carrier protein [Vagococcus penaei]